MEPKVCERVSAGMNRFDDYLDMAADCAAPNIRLTIPGVLSMPRSTLSGCCGFRVLFGTGFGDTKPSFTAGQLATGTASLVNSVTVTLGGAALPQSDILYAGLSPGSISGLYQFNVRIPSTAPTGEVPVTISIGGSEPQAGATIPIQ